MSSFDGVDREQGRVASEANPPRSRERRGGRSSGQQDEDGGISMADGYASGAAKSAEAAGLEADGFRKKEKMSWAGEAIGPTVGGPNEFGPDGWPNVVGLALVLKWARFGLGLMGVVLEIGLGQQIYLKFGHGSDWAYLNGVRDGLKLWQWARSVMGQIGGELLGL